MGDQASYNDAAEKAAKNIIENPGTRVIERYSSNYGGLVYDYTAPDGRAVRINDDGSFGHFRQPYELP